MLLFDVQRHSFIQNQEIYTDKFNKNKIVRRAWKRFRNYRISSYLQWYFPLNRDVVTLKYASNQTTYAQQYYEQ